MWSGDHRLVSSPTFFMLLEEMLPDVEFSLDVWHAAKNLAKDLREASNRRETRPLAAWIGSLKNHFWYCSQKANGDKAHFMVSCALSLSLSLSLFLSSLFKKIRKTTF